MAQNMAGSSSRTCGVAFLCILLLVLGNKFVKADSSSSSKAVIVEASATVANLGASAVPEWKLDLRLNPSKVAQPQSTLQDERFRLPFEPGAPDVFNSVGIYGDDVYAPGSGTPLNSDGYRWDRSSATKLPGPFSSTEGQDQLRCPILKMENYVVAEGHGQASAWFPSTGQSGKWSGSNEVTSATWVQNFWARTWTTLYIKSYSGQLAAKIIQATEKQLYDAYRWKAQPNSITAELTDLDLRHQATKLRITNGNDDDLVSSYALTDCEDKLLFVVQMERGPPGVIDIFDRYGKFLAHTLTDPVVSRHQFIDTNGYLLATAESPGLWMNVSRSKPPTSAEALHWQVARKDVPAYAMRFAPGGYANSSRLLDPDFRWVVVAAVQVRAFTDAYGTWHPDLWYGKATFWLVLVVCVLYTTGLVCRRLLKIFYPDDSWNQLQSCFMDTSPANEKGRLMRFSQRQSLPIKQYV